MKTNFIIICALAVRVAACAPVQAFVDQDKPTRLYVQSYTESVSAVLEGYNNDTETDWPGYEDYTYNATLNENINYADGANGSADCDQFEAFTDTEYFPGEAPYSHQFTEESGADNLNMSSGPGTDYSSVPVTQVETFSGSLFDSWDTGSEGEAAVGSTNTSTAIGLPVFSEHCDNNMPPVNYSSSGVNASEIPFIYTWNYVETYKRTAQIKYTLHAGGKSIPNSRNLFLLNAWATGWTSTSGNLGDNLGFFVIPTPDDGWINIPTYFLQFGGPGANYVSIPLQTVSIGGLGNLDTNGLLYAGVAAGTDVDVTPHASGNQYLCDVGMTEYPLNITVNGTNLSSATPQFCVGQNLLFQLNGLPSSVANMVGQWSLAPAFVNQATNYSPTCLTYVNNNALLQDTNQTACWFYNGGVGKAIVGLSLLFPNGHRVAIATDGSFSVFKPNVYLIPDGGADVVLSTNSLPSVYLGVGDNATGAMGWKNDVYLNPNFPASIYYTQLINRYWDWDVQGGLGAYLPESDHTGSYLLDTEVKYSAATIVNNSGTNSFEALHFGDGPDLEAKLHSYADCEDNFETYLEFQPVGGIPVTLGVIEWGWHGRVDGSYSSSTWSLTTSSITGPTFYNYYNDFPIWPSVYAGN